MSKLGCLIVMVTIFVVMWAIVIFTCRVVL